MLLYELGATRVVAGMGHYLYGVFVFAIVMIVLFVTFGMVLIAIGPLLRAQFPQRRDQLIDLLHHGREAQVGRHAAGLVQGSQAFADASDRSEHLAAIGRRE
jgi:hypothetical protein